MKRILPMLFRAIEKLGNLALSKRSMTRRVLLRTEAREREAMEAERLDRLRNPRDYQGK